LNLIESSNYLSGSTREFDFVNCQQNSLLRSLTIALISLLLSSCSTDSSTNVRSNDLALWIPQQFEQEQPEETTDESAGEQDVTEATEPPDEQFPGARTISLSEVLELSKSNALSIQMARQRTRAAAANQQIANAAFLPTIGPRIDYARTDGVAQGTDGVIVDVSKQSVFTGLEVRFDLDPWGDWHRRLAAEEELISSEQQFSSIEQMALHHGAQLYHDLVRSHMEIDIAERRVNFGNQIVATAKARLEAGDGLREDVLGAQAKEAAAERDLTIAHANAQIASVRLLEFLVLSDEIGSGSILVPDSILMSQSPHVRNHPVPGPLQFPLQDLTANELIERGLQQRPDLMAARAEVRASRSLSRASSAWGHPIVSARTGVGRFGAESGDLDDQETAEVGIGWQFGFDSGASHRRAIAIFEETQLAMKKLELRISAQIRESLARLTASRASMASANRQLEASEETLILVRLRYQAGAALLDELLGREADLSEARTGWLNSILSHNQAQFDLMLAIGGP
jgi:outer membrane protein TolC